MRNIYACDIWDGLKSTFNRVVAKPVGGALRSAVEFVSGEHLLKKYGLSNSERDALRTRANGAFVGLFVGAAGTLTTLTMLNNGEVPDLTQDTASALTYMAGIFSGAALGAVTAPLPRNLLAASRAKKELNAKGSEPGAPPQPPRV